MNDWKKRLYDSYVSTGQARAPNDTKDLENPYFDKLIAIHLPKNPHIAIADLACGHGRLIYSLKKRGFTNVEGVDISQEQVAAAHKIGIPEVKCQDIKEYIDEKVPGSYDVVFLMDFIEHLEKKELLDLLDNVYRILNSNGIVIIHAPNAAGTFGMSIRYGDYTHQNAFTPQSMRQILRACHFADVKCFEDKPVVHGLKSLIRLVMWHFLTIYPRLLLIAETGGTNHILSQNMLVVAKKAPISDTN